MSYVLGSVVPLSIAIRDSSGTLADATNVTLVITLPDQTTVVVNSPSHPSTGNYYYDYLPAQAGRHTYVFTATGTNAGAWGDVFEVTPLSTLPLVSLADVKAHLNAPNSTTNDAEMLSLASMASDVVESYLGRPVRMQTYTDIFDGGTALLRLQHNPCPCGACVNLRRLSITTVVENGSTLTASDYTLDAGSGVVYRGRGQTGRLWPVNLLQNISITYQAGYSITPAWARLSVLRMVENLWRNTQQAPHPALDGSPSGFSFEEQPSTQFVLPYSVQVLLNPHRAAGF